MSKYMSKACQRDGSYDNKHVKGMSKGRFLRQPMTLNTEEKIILQDDINFGLQDL